MGIAHTHGDETTRWDSDADFVTLRKSRERDDTRKRDDTLR